MKIKSKFMVKLLVCFTVLISAAANAQFKIGASQDNCISLSGTSTFQDWTMTATVFSGDAVFKTNPGYYITAVEQLNFSLPVKNLKSGKRELDKTAYEALNAYQEKTINYKLTSAKIIGEKDYKYTVEMIGNLTISGITKKVAILMECSLNKNWSIVCQGKFAVNMTDYKILPPTFFDGLMSTGENVTVDFYMVFELS